MRKLTVVLTVLAVVLHCIGTTRAQSKSDELLAKIEHAMALEPDWSCSSVPTSQGEPGPDDSPRGTKHLFKCQQKRVDLTIFLFYGESKQDAEKTLALSQRLQVNESKPLDGIGEQAYQLSKERFAWITFRKANVYTQVSVGVLNEPKPDSTSEIELVTADALFDAAKLFAQLVAHHIPAP